MRLSSLGHDRRGRRGECRYPNRAGAQPDELRELTRGGVERGGDADRVPREHRARLGQAHAATGPDDEGHAEAALARRRCWLIAGWL